MARTRRAVEVAALSMVLVGGILGAGGVSIPIKLDHRGLLTVSGLLRADSKNHWGAHNLIVKPYGGWAAQDYCLKDIKKDGSTFTAEFRAKPPLRMVQKNERIKGKSGLESLHVSYSLASLDGKAVSYERVYLFFPLASADFAGGKAILGDGTEVPLPQEPAGEDIRLPGKTTSITLSNGKQRFTVSSDVLRISLKDLRPKTTAFQIQLDCPEPRGKSSFAFDFTASAETVPVEIEADGKTWVELPYEREIAPGGILDFSFLGGAPAGTHGRIVNQDGHFAYEATGERVRLIGTNLCYTANYLEKAEADRIAAFFRQMGYNAVRFHHTDVHMRKGNWNTNRSDDIDPAYLDRLDYTFHAMKQAGMYVTIDLYSQRRFDVGEIAGIDRVIEGDIKGLVPIHEPAFEAWKKLVVKWLTHVNPYTGLAWKDDPALLSICPLNEDSIASAWWSAKELYLKRFAEWKAERGLKSTVPDPARDPLFAQFLIETKTASNRKIAAFLRELGVKAMLTGSNWWDTMPQAFVRDQFDLVDNHQYSDHPQPWYLPATYNQGSNLDQSPTYITPIMMASTRIFGKPFTVSEYNYCAPNQHRAEGGAFMGAYAALQDWDGLFRFAWAHDAKRVNAVDYMYGFDLSSDPLNQLTERQIVLLFRRGDVLPATKRYVFGVTKAEATAQGPGDMWSKGLFPRPFNDLALTSQTGSQVIEGRRAVTGDFEAVVTGGDTADQSSLGGNRHVPVKALPKVGSTTVSDTGQVALTKGKQLCVQSPFSECIVAKAGADATAGGLRVSENSTFCSVSASSMDGQPLRESRRVLLLHLTNVLNTGMQFATPKMTTLVGYGKLPYIVRTGSAKVALANSNPGLQLYACDLAGRRLQRVPTEYADGTYSFTATIAAGSPKMVYELATE